MSTVGATPPVEFVNDAVGLASSPNNSRTNGPTQLVQRRSFGRVQPFAGGRLDPAATVSTFTVAQNPQPPGPGPQTTFLRHNGTTAGTAAAGDPTLMVPFDWMVHLDRPVVNGLEVTFVPAVPSHQLTQQFMAGQYLPATPAATIKQQHLPVDAGPGRPARPVARPPQTGTALADSAGLYRASNSLPSSRGPTASPTPVGCRGRSMST